MTFLYGILDSLCNGAVLSAYILELDSGRNEYIGYFEAARASSYFMFSFPIGYIADKWSRSGVLKAGGVLTLVATILNTALVVWVGDGSEITKQKLHLAFHLFIFVMVIMGIVTSIAQGPAIILFADSTPGGRRGQFFVMHFVLYMMASSVGPLLTVILLAIWGNEWKISIMRNILLVGMAVQMLLAISMFFARDKWVLDEDRGGESIDSPTVLNDSYTSQDLSSPVSSSQKYGKFVPCILLVSSFVISCGSGMAIRFFPLFFKDDLNLTPIIVQVIYFFIPATLIICSTLSKRISTKIGRVQAIILSKVFGVLGLYILSYENSSAPAFLLIVIFLIRTACMNATYPLQQSILMESVEKTKRARWKCAESFTKLGWAVSAAVGGVLADKHDYSFTFFITATIQTFGITMYTLLIPLVPKHEPDLENCNVDVPDLNENGIQNDSVLEEANDLNRPLLK